MRLYLLFFIVCSVNVLAQNTLEDCTLGVFINTTQGNSDAAAAAKSEAESLFPGHIASHPDICKESENTERSIGTNGAKSIVVDGISGYYYNPAASLRIAKNCWVCNSFCPANWPERKACFFNTCPAGYTAVDGRCMRYEAAVPEESPPLSCGEDTAGNPISIKDGGKYQIEDDIPALNDGLVSFKRTFNNSNPNRIGAWHYSYQRSIRFIEHSSQNLRAKSDPYATKAAACINGFNDLKNQLDDSWTKGTSVNFENDSCQVVSNNRVVRKISIIPSGKLSEKFKTRDSLQLVRDDGALINFDLSDANQFRSQNGDRGILTKVEGISGVAWNFKDSSGTSENYSASGKLLSIISSNGNAQELEYDSATGLLSRVRDSRGRELVFSFINNKMQSVTVDGNKVTSYSYNAQGLIAQVARPGNTTRIYHYEDSRFPTALTGITDERGVRYATWTYDEQGRAISSEHAGGVEKTTLTFNSDGTTTVTNPLNKQTVYHYEDIGGERRVVKVEGQASTYCMAANQEYTYTSEGWLESKTDWEGIKTFYQYNSLGQEISRTEAYGTAESRTITTAWHPVFYVKTKVTEPDRESTYNYDVNGLLVNKKARSLVAQ